LRGLANRGVPRIVPWASISGELPGYKGPERDAVTEPSDLKRSDARRNRDAILAAALEALTESPDASLNAIAKRAGVANATLYRHFPTRADLVLATYEREVGRLVDAADVLLRKQAPIDALQSWVEQLAGYAVTKHAAVAFAEWLAVTHGDDGVGVSCVCPMGVETPLLQAIRDSPDRSARVAANAVLRAGGVVTPEHVAAMTVDAVRQGGFLVLPHPEVLDMYRGKGADYDRWIAGMQRYRRSLE